MEETELFRSSREIPGTPPSVILSHRRRIPARSAASRHEVIRVPRIGFAGGFLARGLEITGVFGSLDCRINLVAPISPVLPM
jgi:hypothetical protein